VWEVLGYAVYNSRSQVNTNLIGLVTERAEKMSDQLLKMTSAADPVCLYLKKDLSAQNQRDAVEALRESTGSYLVVSCGKSGRGIGSGQITVDISDTDYFVKIRSLNDTGYLQTRDDGVSGKEAVIVAVPFRDMDQADRYIIMYLDKKKWMTIASSGRLKNELDVVVNQQGAVIAASDEQHLFVSDGKLWDNLDEGESDHASAYIVRHTGAVFNAQNDAVIVEAPLMINNWALTTTVDRSLLQLMYAEAWKETSELLRNLLIAIISFVGVGVILFVAEKKNDQKVHEGLKQRAETDPLTGLLNKTSTEAEIRSHIRNNPDKPGVLFLLDVDNFKGINDTLGHAFGDEALREFGFRASTLFRVTDISGRVGGDEFMIFLKNIPEESVPEEVQKLQEFVTHFSAGKRYIRHEVTASVGGACYPKDGMDFEKLYEAADLALYQSKAKGKSKVTMAG
jgi:diguanylate cyclase (GGDEF)-like protein